MRRSLPSLIIVFVLGCTHAQLERAGDAMLRTERATQAVSDGVIAFKDVTKEECIRQALETEAERAACVAKAVKALDVSRVGVSAVAAALTTFWEVYAAIEVRMNAGGRISQDDLVQLASQSARVLEAYARLVQEVQEVRR